MARTLFDSNGVPKPADFYFLEINLSGANRADLVKQAQMELTKQLGSRVFDLQYLEDLNPLMCLELFEIYLTIFDPEEVRSQIKPSGKPTIGFKGTYIKWTYMYIIIIITS